MTKTAEIQSQAESKRRSGLSDFFIRLFREKPLGTVGGVIVLLLLLVAIFAEWIAPFPYQDMGIDDLLRFVSAFFEEWDWDRSRDLIERMEVPRDRELRDMSMGQRRRAELFGGLVVLAFGGVCAPQIEGDPRLVGQRPVGG